MLITAGRICPGHPTSTAVAIALYDIVKVACSDGAGNFANVLEPHGEQDAVFNESVVDYLWDPTVGNVATQVIKDLAVWNPPNGADVAELYANYSGALGQMAEWKIPGTCGIGSSALPMARWGTAFDGMTVSREAVGDSDWGGISCAGPLGLLNAH